MAAAGVISARGVRVRYGAMEAVHGVDLEVSRGDVVGLIGPDGAGKTSTLRVVAGLQAAAAGETRVLGLDAWRDRRRLHERLGMLAQRFALYGDLTVDENVRFFALLYGIEGWRSRRDHLLERVGLARFRNRQADRLSGGMKQKLALACSLMHSPEVLLLDEPTTGVDPVTRREFWRLLADLVADGLTLLVATPYLDEAERCTRVVLMHQGHVLADATPAELRRRLPGTVIDVAATPRAAVTELLAEVQGVLEIQPFAARFHVRAEAGGDPLPAIRAALEAGGATIDELREVEPELEDVFLHLTRSDPNGRGEAA